MKLILYIVLRSLNVKKNINHRGHLQSIPVERFYLFTIFRDTKIVGVRSFMQMKTDYGSSAGYTSSSSSFGKLT
ncbi:hypothetical protein QTP88_022355 [Uroleucon formosanum]